MEEVITKLARAERVLAERDRKFVRSINRRVEKGTALTTRQGYAFLNVLRHTKDIHKDIGMKKEALEAMMAAPQWRFPLVPSVELRSEVRHIGDNMLGFRCSNSKAEVEFTAMKAVYSNGMRIVAIDNHANLNAVIEFIGKWGFQMDVATERFLADCMTHSSAPARVIVEGPNLIIDCPNHSVFAQFCQHVLGASHL